MDYTYNSYFFNEFYAENGGGNYLKKDNWMPSFSNIADQIIKIFNPRTVLDVGCATGYLVEALRDKGVEAYGFDISEYAISNVREDIKPFCIVHSITDPLPDSFPGNFDLVITIEVLEHLYPEEGKKAIANLCNYTDTILFTSTPDDINDKTHVNVQQKEYWARIFAENSFFRDLIQPVDFIAPWAMLFLKKDDIPKVIHNYEMNVRILESEVAKLKTEKIQEELEYYKTYHETAIAQIEDLRCQLAETSSAFESISSSTCWKMTKPLRFLLDFIKILLKSNRITNTFYRGLRCLRENGLKYTCGRIKYKLTGKDVVNKSHPETIYNVESNYSVNSNINAELRASLKRTQPIQSIILNEDIKRINVVTDSIEKNSLLGGVATALIVATEFANYLNIPLRIITRTAPVNPVDYKNIMKTNGIKTANDVTFYSDYDRDENGRTVFKLELSSNDIFFATSWWSAEAIRKTTLRERFFYIIQEVETFFYPHGDEHYLCSQVMRNKNVDFIINSKYLYDYFKEQEPQVAENGVYFEPAFSEVLYKPGRYITKGKYKLFFYARPNNPRNMFLYGIKILEECVLKGIVNTEEWDIYCAGGDIPEIRFRNGYKTKNLGLMDWNDYAVFLREIDLAFCLMYTPHPSYPPYDVACSGGVVVSNKCFNKEQFDQCANVILSDLDSESLLQAMEEGIELAKNMQAREENLKRSTIPRNWSETLGTTMSFMEESVNRV